ncbi:hypothetical protein T630_2967 [Acinetobacter baumannii MRSN 3527]|uniref:Uncharacterized protein n=1 Tax=Acinetobacter baumannii MRSN 3527 TaxID=1409923 RepID=A0A0J0ZRR3_ACIBA|nr:hypothetical protein T630_2967 [Acinetobacter baumannii MRSN 3527]
MRLSYHKSRASSWRHTPFRKQGDCKKYFWTSSWRHTPFRKQIDYTLAKL